MMTKLDIIWQNASLDNCQHAFR